MREALDKKIYSNIYEFLIQNLTKKLQSKRICFNRKIRTQHIYDKYLTSIKARSANIYTLKNLFVNFELHFQKNFSLQNL